MKLSIKQTKISTSIFNGDKEICQFVTGSRELNLKYANHFIINDRVPPSIIMHVFRMYGCITKKSCNEYIGILQYELDENLVDLENILYQKELIKQVKILKFKCTL